MQNTGKNRIEMNLFCMCFETLYGDKFVKHAKKNGVFFSNFDFGKSLQNTGKNRLEMNTFSMHFKTLCGHKFEKKTCKKRRFCE